MFDPSIGRWISEDPSGIEPDKDLFRYCGNDPINRVDPSGLQAAVPALTLDNTMLKEPLLGVFGSFLYPVGFRLKNASATGGWVVQEIDRTVKLFQDNKDVTADILPKELRDAHFWEAWEVEKMKQSPKQLAEVNQKRIVWSASAQSMAVGLILNRQFDNANRARNIEVGHAIEKGAWDDVDDYYGWVTNTFSDEVQKKLANPKLYNRGEIVITAKVFFVNNPQLYEGMRTPQDPKATAENKNISVGQLRNLYVSESDAAKGMRTWLKENEKTTSNVITRTLKVTWQSSGDGIVTKLESLTPKP
jgi:hypothetical protein